MKVFLPLITPEKFLLHVHVYVCMYVCTYVRMYVCVCVCIYVCMYVCMYCVCVCVYVLYVYVCMCVCMYCVCMYVYARNTARRIYIQSAMSVLNFIRGIFIILYQIISRDSFAAVNVS
jgi:hypothetical protein